VSGSKCVVVFRRCLPVTFELTVGIFVVVFAGVGVDCIVGVESLNHFVVVFVFIVRIVVVVDRVGVDFIVVTRHGVHCLNHVITAQTHSIASINQPSHGSMCLCPPIALCGLTQKAAGLARTTNND
jgi:hypothetical protein